MPGPCSDCGGGGGAFAYPFEQTANKLYSNELLGGKAALGTTGVSQDVLRGFPFVVPNDVRVTGVALRTVVGAGALGVAVAGIYKVDANGLPTTKIAGGTEIATDAVAGMKLSTFAPVLVPAGPIVIAVHYGVNVVGLTIRSGAFASFRCGLGYPAGSTDFTLNGPQGVFTRALAYNSILPDPFGAATQVEQNATSENWQILALRMGA